MPNCASKTAELLEDLGNQVMTAVHVPTDVDLAKSLILPKSVGV